MKKAGDVKKGNLLLYEGSIFKVEDLGLKGAAKTHKMVNLRMKSIPEGKFKEVTINPEDKLEEAELARKKAAYSYRDEDFFYFLDAETFENYRVPKEFIGEKECFLKENEPLDMSFYEGVPVEVSFPLRIPLKVTSVDKGIKTGESTVSKKARLENGLEIDVPQFIKENDMVEVDSGTFKYIDRLQE